MYLLTGSKRVVIKLTITDTEADPQVSEKLFLRTRTPNGGANDPTSSDFSVALSFFTGTKSGVIEVLENKTMEVDMEINAILDGDEITDNFGSVYTPIQG